MMYRSASTNRVLDGRFNHHSSSASSKISQSLRALSLETNGLPRYGSPLSDHVAKKGRARGRFSENAVHVIPMVLLFCALILWLSSNPDIDLSTEGASIAERIDGLTIERDGNNDGSQKGDLPLEWGHSDSTKQNGDLRIAFWHRKSLLLRL